MRLTGFALLGVAGILAGCNQGDISSAASRTEGEEFVVVRSATWIDPDGCEHWIFDTGAEGYITPKLQPDGIPVCDPARAERGSIRVGGVFGIVRGGPNGVNYSMSADATFDVNSAVIMPEPMADLVAFFTFLQREGKTNITIVGHTSSVGDYDANLSLSQRRAESVALVASNYGISSRTNGVADTQPVASNETADGRAENRRVEIQVQ